MKLPQQVSAQIDVLKAKAQALARDERLAARLAAARAKAQELRDKAKEALKRSPASTADADKGAPVDAPPRQTRQAGNDLAAGSHAGGGAGAAAGGGPVAAASAMGRKLAEQGRQQVRVLRERIGQIDAQKIEEWKAKLGRMKPPTPPGGEGGPAAAIPAAQAQGVAGTVTLEPLPPREEGYTYSTTRRTAETARTRTWPTRLLYTILTASVAGAVLHIIAIFAVPYLGWGAAFGRLVRDLPENRMVVLPPSAPGQQLLPFLQPDMRYAMCRYEVIGGPVRVTATLPEIGWSLAVYTPQGDNFYAAPAHESRRTDLAFTLLPANDRLINLTPGQRKADVDISTVTSPSREGIVVLRAPIKSVAHAALIEPILRAAACEAIERQ
jgi:uncharacterized membrane protein